MLSITDKDSAETLACVFPDRFFHLSWFLGSRQQQDRVCGKGEKTGICTDFEEIRFNFCKSILTKNSAHVKIANSIDSN